MTPEELTSWLQLVSSGGFGALAWYLIVKLIPRMVGDFREDTREQRSVFMQELKAQRMEFCHTCEQFQQALEKISAKFSDAIAELKKRE